jgi:hypothetical protein
MRGFEENCCGYDKLDLHPPLTKILDIAKHWRPREIETLLGAAGYAPEHVSGGIPIFQFVSLRGDFAW